MMNKLAFLSLVFASSCACALPGPTSAAFRKGAMFTVDGYTGSSPLSGFPVLVRIADDLPSGFRYWQLQSQSDGADLCFVDMEGNGLPFEIDTWDTSGTSLVWVSLPTMTNGTQFVMCWGGATSGKTVCADNPFASYKGVWHMNATSPADASGSGNGGTAAGAVELVSGMVGTGLSYPNKSDYVSCGQHLPNADLFSGFTVGGWANLANTSGNHALFGKNVFMSVRTSGTKVQVTTPGIQDHNDIGANLSANTWFHWTMTFAPGNNGLKFYVNGVCVNTQTASSLGNQNQSGEMWLGRNQWNDQGFQGFLDEMRLSADIKSADWIAATYAAQSSSAFLAAGEAEDYEASASPDVGLTAPSTAVEYTNATLTANVGSLGMDQARTTDADWVDLLLVVSTDADLSSTVLSVPLGRLSAAPASVPVPLAPLATNTTYYAQLRATNSCDVAGETGVVSFRTLAPGAPEGTAEFAVRGFTTLSATGKATTFGAGATSATMRLEASADDFGTVAAFSEVAATNGVSATLEVSGLAPSTEYRLRLRLVNDWGLETFVALPDSVVTLDGPVDASDLRWTFAPDVSYVDVFFDVDAVFDGATPTATLYCDEEDEPTTNRGEHAFSGPGTLTWRVPFGGNAYHAKVVVVSEVGGMVCTQAWTAVVDHAFKRFRPVKLQVDFERTEVPAGASGNVMTPERAFDGDLTTGVPASPVYASVIGCLTNRLENPVDQEAYVIRIEVTHKGDSRYSLYTSEDGVTWTLVPDATNVMHAGTASYSVSAVANFVKCTFESSNGRVPSLFEIEPWGFAKEKAKSLSKNAFKRGIATFHNSDGSAMTANGQGGWNSDCNRLFDGDMTNHQMWPKAGTGGYVVVDFTKNDGTDGSLTEYFVTEMKVSSTGKFRFTLQYNATGNPNDWVDVDGAAPDSYDGIASYPVEKTVKMVRYIWTDGSYNNFNDWYLAEFQVLGINPNDAPCDHPTLSEWEIGAIPATCTGRAMDVRTCLLCKARFTRLSDGLPLGHDYVSTVNRHGSFSPRKFFPDQRRYGEGSITCSRCNFRLDFPTALDLVTNIVDGTRICGEKIEGVVRFVDLSVSSENHPEYGPGKDKIIDGDWSLDKQYPHWISKETENQYADFEFGTEIDLTAVDLEVPNHGYDLAFCGIDDDNGIETTFLAISLTNEPPAEARLETIEVVDPETRQPRELLVWKEATEDYQRIAIPFFETHVKHLRIRIVDKSPYTVWGFTGVRVYEIHPWGTVLGASDYAAEKTTLLILR